MSYGLAPSHTQPTDPVEDLVYLLLAAFAVFTFTYDVALLVPISLRGVVGISALAGILPLLVVVRSWWRFVRALARHVARSAAMPSSWVLGGMCLAAGLVALLADRPAGDDAGYFARAVLDWEAWRQPVAPTYPFAFAGTGAWRFPSIPAWEHAWAALAGLIGLHPLTLYYRLAPLAAGALVPLAWYAVLARVSHSRRAALTGVGAILLLMLLDGTTPRGIALFGLFRIWQGKVVLLSAIAPLALAATLDVMRHGRAGDWVRLALLGVVGMGLSTAAAFYLPILVGIAGGTFWLVYLPPTRIWQPPLAALAVFAYPALSVLPFYRVLAVHADPAFASVVASDLREILAAVYGAPQAPLVIALVLALAGLGIAKRTRLLGWFTLWTAALALPLAWPASADFIVNRLISAEAMWRLAYAGPAMLALGAGVGSLTELRRWRWVATTLLLAAFVAAAGLGLGGLPPSPFAGDTRFPSLSLKLPPAPLAAARTLLARLPPGTMLAPAPLSTVMPLLSSRQRQALFNRFDAPAELSREGQGALAADLACAHAWISARPVSCEPRAALATLAATHRLDTVVLDAAMAERDAAEDILRGAGYAAAPAVIGYAVWRRAG